MPRPPLPVGSHGHIMYRTLGPRRVRARALVRTTDGRRHDISRVGRSREHARQVLLTAIRELVGTPDTEITPESTVERAAQAWFDDLDRDVAAGDLSPGTVRLYRSVWANHVRPAVGQLRLREVTVPRLDAVVVGARERRSAALAKTVKAVLHGIFGLAVRYGALESNPVRDTSRIRSGRGKVARAMTPAEREAWLAAMEADELASWRDLPDLTRFLLATGCRIGEALAVSFDELDLDRGLVHIRYTLVWVKGRGLIRRATKTAAGERTLRLPRWAIDMLRRRGERLGWRGPVFPAPGRRPGKPGAEGGGWRDPSRVSAYLREARRTAGFDWVTSHVFRKTVATVLDEAGLTAREIADQLGQARVSITQDVYLGRRAVGERSVSALEDIVGP